VERRVHVVVVGCGRVGSELAGTLEKQGHTVAVIDKRKDAFRRLPTGFGGYRIVGFGFDRDTLEEAGVKDAGALAAVTSGDNSNIMSARVARETFEVQRVVARIYDPRRAAIYQRLGIPTVATVSWTTDQVIRRLLPGEHPADWTDASGKVSVVERDLPAGWAGQKLAKLDEPGRFVLAAVTRLGAARVVDSDLIGQEGDVLHFAVDATAIDALQARLTGDDGAEAHH
jgi:trk/ktr system potassium uptake protein